MGSGREQEKKERDNRKQYRMIAGGRGKGESGEFENPSLIIKFELETFLRFGPCSQVRVLLVSRTSNLA